MQELIDEDRRRESKSTEANKKQLQWEMSKAMLEAKEKSLGLSEGPYKDEKLDPTKFENSDLSEDEKSNSDSD